MSTNPPRPIRISGLVSNPTSAPTQELGRVLQGVFGMDAMAQFVFPIMDTREEVPELSWPTSVWTYHRMRGDTQIGALYRGATLPIRRYKWMIDPNKADEGMVRALSADLNLPILGEEEMQPRRRRKHRFIFAEHLRKALLALIYGHMFFEQSGVIDVDGAKWNAPQPEFWHLRKLAERMPNTIQNINVAEDGGLVSIQQNIGGTLMAGNRFSFGMPEIPVDRLIAYVWELEGADWFGRSLLRECYKHWLIKDRLMRIDVINHARAGGIPIANAPPGATDAEISAIGEMAQNLRVGESSGGASPAGTDWNILRATARSGTIESMKYHDEAMARYFLMMFMQLGMTQSGSRALGSTFVDFFKEAQDTIAWWFADLFQEHVIEDWVDWNYGEKSDIVPLLKFKRDPELSVTDLAALLSKGAIVVDLDLENALRDALGLPKKAAGAPPPTSGPPPAALPPGTSGVPVADSTQRQPTQVAGGREEGEEFPEGFAPSFPDPGDSPPERLTEDGVVS